MNVYRFLLLKYESQILKHIFKYVVNYYNTSSIN